jgi:hypothetical protein
MKVLRLNPDAVKAVLDSMGSNDHCTVAYDSQIQEIRSQIEEFAGDSAIILSRVPGASDPPGIVINVDPAPLVAYNQARRGGQP